VGARHEEMEGGKWVGREGGLLRMVTWTYVVGRVDVGRRSRHDFVADVCGGCFDVSGWIC